MGNIDSTEEDKVLHSDKSFQLKSQNNDEKQNEALSHTKYAKSAQNKNNIVPINVMTDVYINAEKKRDKFVIHSLYSDEEKLENILIQIVKYLNHKYHPLQVKIRQICGGFTESAVGFAIPPRGKKSMTYFNKNDIINKGLWVELKVEYSHKIQNAMITCEHMNKLTTDDPYKCPIYYHMKQKYQSTENNLAHLRDFTHFTNEWESKPPCKYGQSCNAYIRQENGGDRLEDKCHMKIYRHPPRNRSIKLSQNIHTLIIHKSLEENKEVPYGDKAKYNWNEKNGFLQALIGEVIANDFKYDLCLYCDKDDECTHQEYSILEIVDEKMNCIRHKVMNSPLNRGEMLALILYTGCDCNYDLCAQQRKGNYKKWVWFDQCLYNAIEKLSKMENGQFPVYSGLNGVKLDKQQIAAGYFVTYVSSSWNKDVAKGFMNGDGMIIQIDKKFKNDPSTLCCDVSWISKFPDECEILFARSPSYAVWYNGFSCHVLDESNGVQTVSLIGNNQLLCQQNATLMEILNEAEQCSYIVSNY